MPQFLVYHRKQFPTGSFPLTGSSFVPRFLRRSFTPVALVEAEDLDEVFRLTNTIDHPWWENPHVQLIRPWKRHRSTSVGDVIVQSTQAWLVQPFGFEPITLG